MSSPKARMLSKRDVKFLPLAVQQLQSTGADREAVSRMGAAQVPWGHRQRWFELVKKKALLLK